LTGVEFHYIIMVRQPLFWLPVENLSWFSVFATYCKIVSNSRSIFTDDSLYQKLLILVQLCWRYLKIFQVFGFLRHSVYYTAAKHGLMEL